MEAEIAMSEYHEVQQGEYLSQIARKYGFASYKTIWEAGENSELKNLRKNPNVLLPGDVLFIPDKEVKEESRATGSTHKFEVDIQPLKLRVMLTNLKNKPLVGHQCTFIVDSKSVEITTGGDGMLEQPVPLDAANGKVIDRGPADAQVPLQRETPIRIGHLDPIDTIPGQQARLNNLGYFAGDPTTAPASPAEEQLRHQQFLSAVEEFQCDFDLAVDGVCGPNTQAKLKQVHGC